MPRAVQVAKAEARSQEQTYFWISNHKILFLRHVSDTRFYEALEVDRGTGRETNLKAFNGRYRTLLASTPMHCSMVDEKGNVTQPVDIVYLPPEGSLSPDGRWLVWRSYGSGRPMWIAATIDGTGERRWMVNDTISSGGPHWIRDSRQWVELQHQYRNSQYRFIGAIRHTLEDTSADEAVRLGNVKDGTVLGMTDENTLLIARYPYGERTEKVYCSVCGLHAGIAVTRDSMVSLPRPLAVYGISLSVQGNRLAWLLGDIEDHLVSGKMMELWVSDRKGREMQQVDSIPILEQKSDTGRTQFDTPDELRWLPDDSHLSFLYQKALWIVPIA